jgi:hypothetical protein
VARAELGHEVQLVNVIKTEFVLSGEDSERYRLLVSRKEFRAVQEVELTWADKLIEQGRPEGLEKGLEQGRRRASSKESERPSFA